ncbi:hypothetical protein EVAR_44565_1 [Eumeta japonica]|uniref:Uncharacterized protein n=1 Tax=Eumeta variegata TaxID=151549 RepID=A0A4C1XBZ0_EUMVA|nr:hypothetical protein EVAR_44565_1 [Eumeta japonica]
MTSKLLVTTAHGHLQLQTNNQSVRILSGGNSMDRGLSDECLMDRGLMEGKWGEDRGNVRRLGALACDIHVTSCLNRSGHRDTADKIR